VAVDLFDQFLAPRGESRGSWVWDGDRFERWTFADSYDEARRAAATLRSRGVGPGSVVAAVITNSKAAISGYFGAWFAGATVASLPIIARGQAMDQYIAQLQSLCEMLEAECFLIEGRFAELLRGAGLGPNPPVLAFEELPQNENRADVSPPPENEVIFVQFSSGTTSQPRGVELTGAAIGAQLTRLAERIEVDPASDVGLMWLPMSHDMGFFGGDLLARFTGMEGVLSPPERFLSSPGTWFEDCLRFKATVTVGPGFAYSLAARTARQGQMTDPLSLRLCLVGGEQISMTHLEACASAFQSHGLSLNQFTPAYGLAEATLAVSMGELTVAPHHVWADAGALEAGELQLREPENADARAIMSCGRVLRDFTVSHGDAVGELHVSGPSLANGYRSQPELSAERFRDGAFVTGDLGFVYEDELYLVGRTDDRLIVGGRNIDVGELERELGEEPCIRKGNCAIVDVRDNGSQQIVVVAELAGATPSSDVLSRARELAARRHGLRVDRAVILAHNQFPKTPSGKAQRYRCREIAANAPR
jgi:fatty-acyl-CoA synthase